MRSALVFLLVVLFASVSAAVTFINDFDVPESASGLTHDGEALWIGHLGANGGEIWRITDYDGTQLEVIDAPASGCQGLDWSANLLWYLNDSPASRVYAMTPAGDVVLDWALPGDFMAGLTSGDGDVWVGSYYQPTGYVYRLESATGDSLGIVPTPGEQPRALAWQDGTLWVADVQTGLVAQLDPLTGDTLQTFESPYGSPKGLAYDGRYLWLLDEGPENNADRVYRINSTPDVPMVVVTPLAFDFGAVEVILDSTIEVTVTNVGQAALNVQQIVYVGDPGGFNLEIPDLPVWLTEYESMTFSLTFDPPGIGTFDGPYVYMTTNDPHFSYYEFQVHAVGSYPVQTFSAITQDDPISYGTVRTQQELDAMQVRYYVFANLGTPDLVIESFETTNPDFFISRELPFSVPGGQRDSLAIWWEPSVAGLAQESFTITTNDELSPSVTVGLSGVAIDQYLPGGTVLWEYRNDDEDWSDGYIFVSQMSDVAEIGFPAVLAVTSNGTLYGLNSNAYEDGQMLYSRQVSIPEMGLEGLNDVTGYVSRWEMASIIDDLDGDGYLDVVFGTDGYISGQQEESAGIVAACSGFDGQTLWSFDTAQIGLAPVRDVKAVPDMDGDNLPDVLVTLGRNQFGGGPQTVLLLDGQMGYPFWISSQEGDFYTASIVPDSNGDGIPEVIAGTMNNELYGLDGATGYPIWFAEPGGAVYKIIQVEDIGGEAGRDVIVTTSGGIMAVDPANGATIWFNGDIGQAVEAFNLGVVNGSESEIIVVGQANGQINGILAHSGEAQWEQNVGSTPVDLKMIADLDGDNVPEIAVGTSSNRLSILNGNGSSVRWSYTEEGQDRAVQTVAQVQDVEGNYSAEIVCGTRNGTVRLFTGGLDAQNFVQPVDGALLPSTCAIRSVYPNPFNSTLRFTVELPAGMTVPITVFDILGRRITRIELPSSGGIVQGAWRPAGGLSAGLYFLRPETPGATATRVMYVK